jgi:polyisoprenoid-binding protein YceI
MKRILFSFTGFAALLLAAMGAQAQSSYVFETSSSKLEIDVFREGFLKAFGHDHLIAAKDFSGRVSLDLQKMERSSVTLRVAANSLKVIDPDTSEKDRADVQAAMQGEKVLDSAKFPEIVFTSTGVTKAEKKGDAWSVVVAGTLRLHGVSKSISLPLKLSVRGEELIAEGEVSFLQSDYGITPIKVGGGSVRVKDQLRIRFQIHARAGGKT